MNPFISIKNFLEYINDNWATIVAIAGLAVAIYTKIKNYLKLSKEEKIEAAMKIVKQEMLKYMSDAELEWSGYKNSGNLKKSQVIKKIYEQHPELKTLVDQDTLISIIEKIIDDNMDEMNKVIHNIDPEETAKKLTENDNTNKPKTTETEDKK
jgi:hypothetical protein